MNQHAASVDPNAKTMIYRPPAEPAGAQARAFRSLPSQSHPAIAQPSADSVGREWDGLVEEVRNNKLILSGIGLLGSAGCAIFLAARGTTLAIRRVPLPSWSMYVAAGVLAVIGLLLIAFNKSEKCRGCGELVESRDAYFPLQSLPVVMQAGHMGDSTPLFRLPAVPKNQMKMVVNVQACIGCKQIAKVSISKWQDQREEQLMDEKLLRGQGAAGFATIAMNHSQWRGEEDE